MPLFHPGAIELGAPLGPMAHPRFSELGGEVSTRLRAALDAVAAGVNRSS